MINRHDTLSIEDFNEKYLLPHIPVIISGSVNWPALKKWNLEYFNKIYPNKMVELTVFTPKHTKLEEEAKDIYLNLPSALNLIYNNTDQTKKHYLMQNSIETNFPELVQDIDIPIYTCRNKVFNKNLWIGEKGVNTRPHYDYSNNFLTQIKGKKRVRLYAPIDSPNMYSYLIKDTELKNNSAVHISRISDTDYLNYELYPNFRLVKYFESILYPGDLLFIPSGWWHELKSLDPSISVNFWWKMPIYSLINSQLTDIICSTFYWQGDLFDQKIHEYFDLSEFENGVQISEFALTKNLLCVSAIFLLNFINKNCQITNEEILKWKNYLNIAIDGNNNLIKYQEIVSILKSIKANHVK